MSRISLKEAREIAFNHLPKIQSIVGLRTAGHRAGFLFKASDGFHWEVDKKQFMDFIKAEKEQPTVATLAERLGCPVWKVAYIMLKNNITLHIKFGKKRLRKADVKKISTIYRGSYHE